MPVRFQSEERANLNEGSPLKPWSEEPKAEATDVELRAYLWMAGILCGVMLALGSHALLWHFSRRPSLAAADPVLQRWLTWARAGGWALAGLSLGAWLRGLWRSGRKD